MKITINVTQRDIDSKADTYGNICATCPIARAVRRTKRFKDCIVGYSVINSHLPFNIVANLPIEVSQWIRKYGWSNSDRSTAKPFKFTVEVKDENA